MELNRIAPNMEASSIAMHKPGRISFSYFISKTSSFDIQGRYLISRTNQTSDCSRLILHQRMSPLPQRAQVKEGNPGIAFGEVGRKLGELWKAATAEEKATFEEQAAADKVQSTNKRRNRKLSESFRFTIDTGQLWKAAAAGGGNTTVSDRLQTIICASSIESLGRRQRTVMFECATLVSVPET